MKERVFQGANYKEFLARLLYKNYDFLILDEFSNALDESNEKFILNTLFEKYKEKQ